MRKKSIERVGFSKSLISLQAVIPDDDPSNPESGYTWGMVVQGFTKKKKKGRHKLIEEPTKEAATEHENPNAKENEEEWWWPIRERLGLETKFPLVDQPVSEALCILGDLDNWQVGVLSNNAAGSQPLPVGMSRLVSNMLEAFVCMWKEFRSPEQVIFRFMSKNER